MEVCQQPRCAAVRRHGARDCLDIRWPDSRRLAPEHEWRGRRLQREECTDECCGQQLH
jgi:hypothetical protein